MQDVRPVGHVGLLLAVLAGCPGPANEASVTRGPTLGRRVYEVHCQSCHGAAGHGDGVAASALYPRPRDLTGPMRLRSTPTGQPPTDDDVLAIVRGGVPGAPMPGLAALSADERAGLLRYLKQLSPALARGPVHPIVVGPEPAVTPASLEAGKALYARLGCDDCHGEAGRGDGPAAEGLVDDHARPNPPRDLVREPYKGGARARDIYVRLTTGMDGSAMPAVTDQEASAAQRWQLAQYVASLAAGPTASAVAAGGEPAVRSRRVEVRPGRDEPLAAAWQSAPALEVPVFPLWSRPRGGAQLTVRSVHDARGIAIRIDWPDETRSDRSGATAFGDAVAVQLVSGARPAFIGMGDPRSAVTIWHWKADWQRQLDERSSPGQVPGARVTPPVEPGSPFPARSAIEADNPNVASRRETAVEEGAARGLGTFTAQPADRHAVTGRGVWVRGRWYVVLTRDYPSDSIPDRVAFAIWDGAMRDRAGHKLVSGWYPLVARAR